MEPFEQAFPGLLISGAGSRGRAADLCSRHGRRVLVVTGSSSLERSGKLDEMLADLKAAGLAPLVTRLSGEPSVRDADEAALSAREFGADCVLGIGGGSALDLAKATSALALSSDSAADCLEGIGSKRLSGAFLPWIALPTTAGTGSECTPNAVLAGTDASGKRYKRSLRHPGLLPRAAIIDPDLHRDCPTSVSVPCAFDALAQLLEPATSRRATPVTDALVFRGLGLMAEALPRLLEGRAEDADRLNLALAASFSGIGLSGAGLGLVHGIAGSLGAIAGIPHGIACALLLYPCFQASLERLERDATHGDETAAAQALIGLERFSRISAAMSCGDSPGAFINLLRRWTLAADLPSPPAGLSDGTLLDRIAEASSSRDSYARIETEETRRILSGLSLDRK